MASTQNKGKGQGQKGSATKPSGTLPGIKCHVCLASGVEVWVAPGRTCHKCGAPIG